MRNHTELRDELYAQCEEKDLIECAQGFIDVHQSFISYLISKGVTKDGISVIISIPSARLASRRRNDDL